MSQKLENAKGLYLEGINEGRPQEALDKYTGARYTQHSTGVADGKEGFLEFFIPFLKRNPIRDIRILRTIEDGQYVFVHVHQSLNNGQYHYVTADMFDTDENDKIIEHWDVIQEEVRQNVSSSSMVNGPSEIEDEDKTEENRTLITDFFNDVLIGKNLNQTTRYISNDYTEHNPIADGMAFNNGTNYVKVHKILVQGNFAAALSHTKLNDKDWCVIDIFRMKDGKIVEHWDVQEKIGSKETWNNSGKF